MNATDSLFFSVRLFVEAGLDIYYIEGGKLKDVTYFLPAVHQPSLTVLRLLLFLSQHTYYKRKIGPPKDNNKSKKLIYRLYCTN